MLKKLLALVACLSATLVIAAVDVNKATEAELNGVRGVGPSTTQLILAERKKAPFKDWNDLIARVKGIGEARASRLASEGLTVSGAAFTPTSTGNSAMAKEKAGTLKAKAVAAQEQKK